MQTTTNFRFSYLSSLDTGSLQQIKLNENFALNDLMLNARLYSLTPFVNPPVSPINGVFYLVGKNAIEAFSGSDAKLASFTQNGWRFTDLSDGMIFFLLENSQFYYAVNGGFERLISQSMYSSGGNTFIQVVPQSEAITSTSGGLTLNDIKPLQANIAALQNATATLEAKAELYVLKTSYEQSLPLIAQNTNDILNLKANVANQKDELSKNISDLTAKQASDVSSVQTSISGIAKNISDLSTKQASDVSSLQTSIAGVAKNISDLSAKEASDVLDLQKSINTLQSYTATNKASISDLEAKQASDAGVIQTSIAGVAKNISDLTAKQASDVSSLQSALNTLQSNAATKASVSDLSTKQASDVSSLQGSIASLNKKEQDDIGAINVKIDSVLQTIAGIKSNGVSFAVGDFKTSAIQSDHTGFLICNGRAVSRVAYSALFNVIGTSFGTGDGSSTFNLPDFRGKVFGAIGQGSGLSSRTIGSSVGAETHTLTQDQTPLKNHSHVEQFRFSVGANYPASRINTPSDFVTCIAGSVTNPASPGVATTLTDGVKTTTQNTASDDAIPHNNMQPTLFAGNYFIYSGVL